MELVLKLKSLIWFDYYEQLSGYSDQLGILLKQAVSEAFSVESAYIS